MKKIRVSDPAERDLDDIWYYIAKKLSSIETANRVVDSITERFSMLAKQPAAGRRRERDRTRTTQCHSRHARSREGVGRRSG